MRAACWRFAQIVRRVATFFSLSIALRYLLLSKRLRRHGGHPLEGAMVTSKPEGLI
jgi:hypothetical protein